MTADVVELTLAADSGAFPAWEPGAHLDLELPGGLVRQYSLCGRSSDVELRVAVLREPDGRGASRAIHELAHPGASLRVRGPRNHFRLRPADFVLFVAGGIGITPLLPMIDECDRRGTPWRLLFLGRARERMPYLGDLLERHPARVYAWPSAERGRYDLDDIWTRMPAGRAFVYACGPEQLLSGLEESARRHDREDAVVVERSSPRSVAHGPNRPIELVLARRGRTVTVAADESVLDAANAAGAGILSTCREGTCGTCEVRVLGGIPEHRDSVLSAEERLGDDTMMTCVSRCRGSRLVLDV
ncbi:MAG TPA: PDR/VanB family oxidoreductase [Microbacterium sp.]|nr:PDR/VanB family oxidoreductase [Microbacterium sp.]